MSSEIIPPESWTCLVCQRTFGFGTGYMGAGLICKMCAGADVDEARESNRARLEAEAAFLETHEPASPLDQIENPKIQKENYHE